MRSQDFKSLDVFALGLIWSFLLTNLRILTHSDSRHPAEFLLLETLRKVDSPSLVEVNRLGFTVEAQEFIELSLNGDMESIRTRWKDWAHVAEREQVLSSDSKCVDEWICESREAATLDLDAVSSDVLSLIR